MAAKSFTCLRLAGVVVLLLQASACLGDTLRVAVASNFSATLALLQPDFERTSGHRMQLIPGSSGRHFAQISNGAPFDLFLSADAERIRALEAAGRINAGQRRVYALGRLALWTREANQSVSLDRLATLAASERVAIANPRLAPYGQAAVRALTARELYAVVEPSLVMGENVGQTFQFAYSGSARFAFVAYSQVLSAPEPGSYALVPDDDYEPIVQEMALLKESEAAHALFDYLSSPAIAPVLERAGYYAPNSH